MGRLLASQFLPVLCLALLGGCGGDTTPDYGTERALALPGTVRQTWAVAPAVNLSGQKAVDPILQADLLHQQLQQVAGLTVVPVNRVVEVYGALKIEQVQSEEQAKLVCDLLGVDALVVATVTAYDPYDPPKLGASVHLFRKGGYQRPMDIDVRELARRAAPATTDNTPARGSFAQVVGMFDAANGSVRAEALAYAQGRSDPKSPYQARICLIEMDRFCGFVYHALIGELLAKPVAGGI